MKTMVPVLGFSLLVLNGLSAQDVSSGMKSLVERSEGKTTITQGSSVPAAYPSGRYQVSWDKNPFLRKTHHDDRPKVDWAHDWKLAGMYKDTSGKMAINLQNSKTGEWKRVTSDGVGEFKLVSASFSRYHNLASVQIEKDGQRATLKYIENLTR